MAINFELLDAAIEDAANGRQGIVHDQRRWIRQATTECDTSMCLAGFAALRAGANMPPRGSSSWFVDPRTGAYIDAANWPRHTDPIHVATFARDAMGLASDQAEALFEGDNTIDGIRAMRDHLVGHPDAHWCDLRQAAGMESADD